MQQVMPSSRDVHVNFVSNFWLYLSRKTNKGLWAAQKLRHQSWLVSDTNFFCLNVIRSFRKILSAIPNRKMRARFLKAFESGQFPLDLSVHLINDDQ